MGLTSSLSIGRTALTAYQAALAVVGNNIANAATPGFSRISPDLSGIPGPASRAGQVGSGVQLSSVRRNVNEALQARLRSAMSDKESGSARQLSLDRVEGIFNPLGDMNLDSLLGEFFAALGELQNTPENLATRGIVITAADALCERIRGIHGDLVDLQRDLNAEIEEATRQADELTTRIAELNIEITTAESASGGPAAALRDQRDQLLGELSELFGITVREQPSGAVNVYVGNDAVVQFGQSFGLKTETELNDDGIGVAVVRLKLNDGPITATSGLVEGLITARDTHLGTQFSRLDTLAAALIREVNNVHASGKGLEGFSELTSLTAVLDQTLALSDADNGIEFPPHTGSFFIDVKDTVTGTVVRTQINIDLDGIGTDSTLNSVAADITANVAGVTATVLADGRLQLTAASGSEFTFAGDTSGFLAAMGMNAFFSGTDSSDIAVNPLIANSPALLAAAQSDLAGDGSNATALASLQTQAVNSLGGMSVNEYYTTTMAGLAVSLSSARSSHEASTIIFDSLTVQRESLSGVSLDEEAIAMVSYQRAYQGAARFLNVVDEMMQTLLTLIR
ncbi:MAG: flagellar hook-associated protein FlgK [Phycisphaerae bacterium]|nr:flagellar hook-associated protein FlgK [Phycisphaerae bacterium]